MYRQLGTLATELGFVLDSRQVRDVADAEALRFRGSPTILVDGRDAVDEEDTPIGLSCRIYITPAGPAGAPTVDQLRGVVRRGEGPS